MSKRTKAPEDLPHPISATADETLEDPGAAAREFLPDELRLRRNFWDALTTIDRSGTAEMLEVAIVTAGSGGGVMGRPRDLTVRALLVVLLTLMLERREPTITGAHRLVESLPGDLLAALGLARRGGTVISRSKIDHLWNRCADACNDAEVVEGKRIEVTPEGKRINKFKARCLDPKALEPDRSEDDLYTAPKRGLSNRGEPRDLGDGDLETRRAMLHSLIDRLLGATVPHGLPYEATAVDWTDLESPARTYHHPRDGLGNKLTGLVVKTHTPPRVNGAPGCGPDETSGPEVETESESTESGRSGRTAADPTARYGRRHPKKNRLPISKSKRNGTKTADEDAFDGRNEQ
ncbi:MAG: hypothetical protein ACYCU7_07075 [Acidimicrobiales bacterium]